MQLSIVDIASVPPGQAHSDALNNSVSLAKRADELGFSRYWVAEHHAVRAQASYAPEVLIPSIASATRRIRVGSGAVLLNHYSPFKVAEVFRQLHAFYPDRIDLGIGRASAGQALDYALQRDRRELGRTGAAEDYGEQITEVLAWLGRGFDAEHPFGKWAPLMPDVGTGPPAWLLGSSPGSAAAAGQLGLPYTYAAFINPAQAREAFEVYRANFTPSNTAGAIAAPHAILAINAVCADNGSAAAYHAMTVRGLYHRLAHGGLGDRHPGPQEAIDEMGAQVPATDMDDRWNTRSIAGNAGRVRELIEAMSADVAADEVMIQDMVLDQSARRRSYQLLADAFDLAGTDRAQ